jgi:fermentation-respiration switch protein FrsA (DUF1100 family)
VRHVALIVVAASGLILAVLWAFQQRLIYFPSPGPLPRAGDLIPGARDVELETDDGLSLGAWFVPAPATRNGFAVLVANGNAGDRSLRSPLARALVDEGFAVLLFDYRGYGGNPGQPSEEGLSRDARAAYRFLTESVGVAPDRLLYFGESLGAAVVAELARERPPAGLVLRSPFTDLAAVGRVHYPFVPVGVLLRDRYPVIEHIRDVSVPTIIVYGTRDSIVPPEQSRAVAKAAGGPTTVIEIDGADHNDMALLSGDELVGAVAGLAERIAGPSGQTAP